MTRNNAEKAPAETKKPTLGPRNMLIVGVALFTMFFGAGNLIFPPILGFQAGQAAPAAFLGFVVSAIGLPVLGVVAVAKAGELPKLAGRVSPRFAKGFTLLIVLAIGPLLAIPRTASTSFSMVVSPFVTADAEPFFQLVYSLSFFAIAFVLAKNPNRITAFLGKVSGPVLLVLVAVIVVGVLVMPMPATPAPADDAYAAAPALAGFLAGYQTMDALAALLFGVIIAMNIRQLGVTEERAVARVTSLAGVVMGVVEALVYCGLAYVGVWAAGLIPAAQAEITGATVLTTAANALFGSVGVVIIGVIFILACLNVCCGLLCTVSEHFSLEFPRLTYSRWLVLFTVASFAFANFGLATIIAVSVPVLEALYPVAIVLIVMGIAHGAVDKRPLLWKSVTGCTAVASVLLAASNVIWPAGGTAASPLSCIPLADVGFGWVIPAAVGVAIGLVMRPRSDESADQAR